MNMRFLWLIPLALIVGLIVWNWNWSVAPENVVGTYVNTNYDNPHCCVEAPHQPDTLVLLSNGVMHSGFYGTGTWELRYNNTEIHWSYPYEHGMAGYAAGVVNEIGTELRLELNYKTNHYYRKIRGL